MNLPIDMHAGDPGAGRSPGSEPQMHRLPHRSIRQALKELYESRATLFNMVRRDFTSKHMNSFLGTAWSLLNPLLLVAVFSIVFRFLFRALPPNIDYPYAVFFYGGLVLWSVLASSVTGSTGSIVQNAYLIQKVYIPREIFPLSAVISNGITFIFEFAVLLIFMAAFRVVPGWTFVLAPIFPILALFLAAGVALLLSALTVQFRDIEHLVTVGVQLWFFLTPVLYSLDMISNPLLRKLLELNPATPIVDGWRDVVLNGVVPEWHWVGYSFVWALVLFVVGYSVFNRREALFAELI